MDDLISTSTSTIAPVHQLGQERTISAPPSPISLGLPSPPDSPLSQSDSVSSFPSVSSSFFFSSAAASPPHIPDHPRDSSQELIIPSLTLPPALRRPTPYGKTLGEVRLIVLGDSAGILPSLLFDDNEHVVEIETKWEDVQAPCPTRTVKASTDWVEHTDGHGLERYEPTNNVKIIDIPSYDRLKEPSQVIETIRQLVQEPFETLSDAISLDMSSSTLLVNLLASPSTPLITALIFFIRSPPSPAEQLVINSLGSLIPIIPITHQHRPFSAAGLSSFRPSSNISLRNGIFQSPHILSALRTEGAHRFVQWMEVHHVVDNLRPLQTSRPTRASWSKQKWESDLEISLAQSVAHGLRRKTKEVSSPSEPSSACTAGSFPLDPLHLPSMILFSTSLFGPLKRTIVRSLSSFASRHAFLSAQVAFLSGLVVGFGLSIFVVR
ncbi:hypothetical protein DL96DRAFT_1596824 [Flagelloscypha sp. PMI_526]|nr:hypothetical protein DL96DRAFT_1596824 [Flagelloscypha sp. PMI_526]